MRPQTNMAQVNGKLAASANSRDVVAISAQAKEAMAKQDLFQRYTNTFGVGAICVFDEIQINSVVISCKVEGNFYAAIIIKINGIDKTADKIFTICRIVIYLRRETVPASIRHAPVYG